MELSEKKETDFYIRSWTNRFGEETITFKHPEISTFQKYKYDWYILTALEKADKVKEDRHLLTGSLLLNLRWAIREAYQHTLDPAIRRDFDQPRCRNTIKGIEGWIKKIQGISRIE